VLPERAVSVGTPVELCQTLSERILITKTVYHSDAHL
jgi:hypothetical protein